MCVIDDEKVKLMPKSIVAGKNIAIQIFFSLELLMKK